MTKILALPLEIQQEDKITGLSHFGKEKEKKKPHRGVASCYRELTLPLPSALGHVCVLGGG